MKNSGAKILLIDDNPKNLQVAMGILSKEGYNLIYAQDGEKGIKLATEGDFDLILLDIVMPTMDGYSVCQQLKNSPKTEDIPIIFLTVKDEQKDIIKGFEYGGVDYVTKPFYAEVLLKRVNTHLSLAKTTKEFKNLNENLAKKTQKQVERLRLKDQMLFQQAKMASMGEMIANIAHQWRQPLSAISTVTLGLKTKFALEKFDLNDKDGRKKCIAHVEQKLNDIEDYVTSLSDTIDDFKNFFKPQKEFTTFYISKVIDNSLKLLYHNIDKSEIKILRDIEDVEIKALENELSQTIINILINAKDALMEQKEVQKLIFISTKVDNDLLYISIKDSGGGIKQELMTEIFKPYFTTKQKSGGTGIGLYMSKEIIKRHMCGEIDVCNVQYKYENRDYSGAKFTIKIPICPKNC